MPTNKPIIVAVAAAVVGAAIAVALWLIYARPDPPPVENGAGDATGSNGSTESNGGAPAVKKLPGFREAATESGIDFRMNSLPDEQGAVFKMNLYDHGSGLAIGDYDGDGHDDVYFLNQLGPNVLFRNRGDGSFERAADDDGTLGLDDRVCVAAAFGDIDNDGDQDLYVTSVRGGNVLFKNRGDGQFDDATEAAGLKLVAHSQSAAFFDFDNDRDLDLFVTNTAEWTSAEYSARDRYYPGPSSFAELIESPKEQNVFYVNEGDGAFRDATESVGLGGKGWAGDAVVFDYDRDGFFDVLVTNMFGMSQLYRNREGQTFEDVSNEALERTSWGAIGAAPFDFDNDGRLDLLLADMHSDMWMGETYDLSQIEETKRYAYVRGPGPETIREEKTLELLDADRFQIDYDRVIFGNTFFKNQGDGRFEELAEQLKLETFWPWGVAPGDFDNDGRQDVFITAGMGYPWGYWRNSLLMNDAKGSFADRGEVYGIEPPPGGPFRPEPIDGKQAARSSRCAATADFDGDGRLDLMVNNFNDVPYYFRNEFPKQNYIAFRLQGAQSNRDAIGALVTLRVGDETMVRQVNAACGYLSQSSKTLHFGLGDRESIDKVEIVWPSGQSQTLDAPALNRRHDLVEPSAAGAENAPPDSASE